MKILLWCCKEHNPLSQEILAKYDKVHRCISLIDLRNAVEHCSAENDDIIVSCHTCAGVFQILNELNDLGVDISFHLHKISPQLLENEMSERGDHGKYYFANRDVKIPALLKEYGYPRVYFGEEYDEK